MNGTPPPQPPLAGNKKGMPALAWVGIGCGTFVIIGIIGAVFAVGWLKGKVDNFAKNPDKAAAELLVKVNPDLEMVSQDDKKGEMTIRTKKGEVVTLSYKDIAKGKITVTGADGSVSQLGGADISKVPSWVPQAPGLSDTYGAFHQETPKEITGAYSAKTTTSPEDLEEFFKTEAGKLGLTSSSRSSFSANGAETVSFKHSGGKRELSVVVTVKPGEGSALLVTYREEK